MTVLDRPIPKMPKSMNDSSTSPAARFGQNQVASSLLAAGKILPARCPEIARAIRVTLWVEMKKNRGVWGIAKSYIRGYPCATGGNGV